MGQPRIYGVEPSLLYYYIATTITALIPLYFTRIFTAVYFLTITCLPYGSFKLIYLNNAQRALHLSVACKLTNTRLRTTCTSPTAATTTGGGAVGPVITLSPKDTQSKGHAKALFISGPYTERPIRI